MNFTLGLKNYQMKHIIEQFNNKNPENAIKYYKSKSKIDLEQIIKKNRIDFSKYEILNKNPVAYGKDILKKAGIIRYNETDQIAFQNELEQNERYKNPLLALNQYTNKEGIREYLTPQEHQKKFIKQFIYSNLRGSIVFHGVGSGKTLTAVISSYYYLKLYPNNKVIVISPSALLFNFVAGMIQYGLDKNDNRYYFYTYDKYNRNPMVSKNALLIVDEAHNFRTPLHLVETLDPETNEVLETTTTTNKRCMKIMKYGSDYCHKILLLTGTVFVNWLHDIENLLAMVDKRLPSDYKSYDTILDNVDNIKDYFDYKISYYPNSKEDSNFPKRIDEFVPIYMTEEEKKKYESLKSTGHPKSGSDFPNAFFSAEKYASNMIGGINNPKLTYIIKLIKERSNQKFIIYSNLNTFGIKNIEKRLNEEQIKYKLITGSQNSFQKEESKLYFNYYNFKKPDFFDTNTSNKYINNEYRILLITRAGAEGVDTINCQNIVLYDSQWNDALSEQIIARAIRFKSHIGLPLKERYVNVIKPVYCFDTDKNLVENIQKGKIDYVKVKNEVKESIHEQLKLIKTEDKRYDPTLKELKQLKQDGKLFIPEKTEYKKTRGAWGRKGQIIQMTNDGWDKYDSLTTPESRKVWRINQFYKFHTKEKKTSLTNAVISVDLWLYIVSKSKQKVIDGFISQFGGAIKLYETYENLVIKKIKEAESKLKRVLTEEESIKIYKEEIMTQQSTLLKYSKFVVPEKNRRNSKNQLQQFYTNPKLAKFLINNSSLSKNKKDKITILEPTAGQGALISPIIEVCKKTFIEMVEIDPENRKVLQILAEKAPLCIKLCNQNNFLTFTTSTRYDYIFMNPPFHLRKNENANLIKDVYDYDFVKRAFAYLTLGGELLAIISNIWKKNDEFKKWLKNINYEEVQLTKESFSGIKIDVCVLKLIKNNTDIDNEILTTTYYYTDTDKGKLLNASSINPKKIFNEKKIEEIDLFL